MRIFQGNGYGGRARQAGVLVIVSLLILRFAACRKQESSWERTIKSEKGVTIVSYPRRPPRRHRIFPPRRIGRFHFRQGPFHLPDSPGRTVRPPGPHGIRRPWPVQTARAFSRMNSALAIISFSTMRSASACERRRNTTLFSSTIMDQLPS
jgi:hypothetical protein